MRILRTREVIEVTGLSRTTIWRLERNEDFPRRYQLGSHSVGWNKDEIDEWLKSRRRANQPDPKKLTTIDLEDLFKSKGR